MRPVNKLADIQVFVKFDSTPYLPDLLRRMAEWAETHPNVYIVKITVLPSEINTALETVAWGGSIEIIGGEDAQK